MWKCPVCEKENSMLLCESCGFDGSCDFERYPSLGRFAGTMDSVASRKAQVLELQTKPVQLNVNDYIPGSPVVEQIKKEQNKPEANPQKRIRRKSEKLVFTLGLIVLPVWIYLVWLFMDQGMPTVPLITSICGLVSNLGIQFHLLKYGFVKHRPKKPLGSLANHFYAVMKALCAITCLFGLCFSLVCLLDPGPGAREAIYGLLTFLAGTYYGLWTMCRHEELS